MSMECEKKKAPIGVFDSGVGGLTVVREITRQLPHENIVYFGDTARVPYGSKSKSNIIRFSEQIIRFLKTKQVKAIVIACNTASALALDTVRDEFDIPIIGVIVPGARAAVEATANGEIGVVGTDATVKSGTYTKVIHQMDPNIHVREKACPLFVPLVEEGFKEHVVTEEVIEYYLESLKHTEIDAMILGCTHYPLLRSKIRAYMGERIQIVNPAYETAMDLKRLLQSEDMENDGEEGTSSKYEFYVSDAAEKYKRGIVKNIGTRENEYTIAQNLYRVLREFDEEDVDYIYSEAFAMDGIGSAVMNRLKKAAGHHMLRAEEITRLQKYRRILFLSNTDSSRGPMAAELLRNQELLQEYDIESRGLVVPLPEPVNQKAEAIMKSQGMSIADYKSRQFTEEDLDEETLVLAIDDRHKWSAVADYENIKNVYTLGEYIDDDRKIPSAYGQPLTEYGSVYEMMKEFIEKLAQKLNEEVTKA